jgi:hypothetical protein
MDPSRCLFCTQAVAAHQPRCPALQLAGVAAHAACSTASPGITGGAPAEQPGAAR